MDISKINSHQLQIPLLAIIPAKGKSQRCLEKNKRLFGKDPLFLLSVHYAREEGGTPVVSTDSEEIMSIRQEQGILFFSEQVDDSRMENCVRQVLSHTNCQVFALLQPTSPFRKKGLLRKMLMTANKRDASSCLTVQKIKLIGFLDGAFHSVHREHDCKRFFFFSDGNLFLNTAEYFHKNGYFFDDNSLAFVNSFPYCLQIDTETEFKVLKHLLSMDESGCWLPSYDHPPIELSYENLYRFK